MPVARTAADLKRIHLIGGEAITDADRDRAELEASNNAAVVRGAEFPLKVAEDELAQARAVLERPAYFADDPAIEVIATFSGRLLHVMEKSETVVVTGARLVEIDDRADLES